MNTKQAMMFTNQLFECIQSRSFGKGDNGVGPLSAVADIDNDGRPEIVTGNMALRLEKDAAAKSYKDLATIPVVDAENEHLAMFEHTREIHVADHLFDAHGM